MFFEFAKVFSKMCRKILCERLEGVISGIEAFWERLFKGVLETTTSKSERDFNVSSI